MLTSDSVPESSLHWRLRREEQTDKRLRVVTNRVVVVIDEQRVIAFIVGGDPFFQRLRRIAFIDERPEVEPVAAVHPQQMIVTLPEIPRWRIRPILERTLLTKFRRALPDLG